MGGAAEHPQRSSSPLKRRASDLESEPHSSQTEDVDMVPVPSSPSPSPSSSSSSSSSSASASASSSSILENVEASVQFNATNAFSMDEDSQTQTTNDVVTDIPDINAQIKTVTTIIEAEGQRQLQDGDQVYLVSNRWLERVKCRGSEARKVSKVKIEEAGGVDDIGPIDNSDITLQIIKDCNGMDFVQLRSGLGLADFTLFPEAAWNLVLEWYGIMPGTLPIVRTAHNTNPDKSGVPNVQFEFYPLIIKVHRLHGANNPILIPPGFKATDPDAPIFVFSRSTKWLEFLKLVKEKTGIDTLKKIRVWRVPRLRSAALPESSNISAATAATPPSSRPGSPIGASGTSPSSSREPQDLWTKLLLDVPVFVRLEKNVARELLEAEDVTINSHYNGSRDLSMSGLGDDQTIVLDEHVSTGDHWVSNHVSRSSQGTSMAISRTGAASSSQNNSRRNSPAPVGAMMTRGRAQKSGSRRTIGTVGLSNLGNTCYMNSALQCIRSVDELTKYFLSGHAMDELNRENPLGNNGEVAMAYAKLLEELYREPVPSSIPPRHFKNVIGRYAPSFSGYGQQDSQEFLGFLLDGLQEDLSRVKKKPYIEKPDSTDEMVNNADAIREMAAQVWDITKKRDDSVIADLFTGMYKSTLVCPICNKVSITFDPFNNLTLQLPIESTWSHKIFYFPLNDKPFIMQAEIDKQGSMMTLRQFVSSRVGVPVERLFPAEVFKSKFYKFYKDFEVAAEVINNSDELAFYELEAAPTNWPPPPKLKKKNMALYDTNEIDQMPHWADPLAQSLLVPVVHRCPSSDINVKNNRYAHKKAWIIECPPHFILLTPEEARSYEVIKRKVLEKIASLSTSPDLEDEEADSRVVDNIDPDLIITNGSDAESGGDSKVVAHSVDGEEDVVDITTKRACSSEKTNPDTSNDMASKRSRVNIDSNQEPFRSNRRRPRFIDPSKHLNPRLQNMFEVGYCQGSNELIPTGWNTIDEDKAYPSISSRNPQLQQTSENGPLDDDGAGSVRAGSETSEEEPLRNQNSSTTRMTEESDYVNDDDDDDDAVPPPIIKALPMRPAKSAVKVGPNKRRPRQKQKTYSKKGKFQSAPKISNIDTLEQDATNEGPLVRLGEILIVDWNPQAYDALFGGTGSDDLRGHPTWQDMPLRHDAALDAKRELQMQRKKNGISLEDCLDEFGKEEILSEADTWYCPRCKEHRRASKKFELWKTPDILIMHLKRFSSSANRRDKLDVLVDFPVEGLDLTSRVIERADVRDEIYDLFAVDDHWGGLGGGHYTAHAKNFFDNNWYEYNDSSVSKLKNFSDVVSSGAYLLFYRRRSELPLGGPKLQHIVEEYHNRHTPSEDDNASESGEDRGLDVNSSLHGSPSALTRAGVGVARHPGSDRAETTTINSSDLEQLPAYATRNKDDGGLMPLSTQDAVSNGLQTSIEDEGFAEGTEDSINMFHTDHDTVPLGPVFAGGWNFDGLGLNARGDQLVSGTASEDEFSSDRVQRNSCPSETSLQGRYPDFEETTAEDFVDPSPVPDMDEDHQVANIAFQHEYLEQVNRNSSFQLPQYVSGDDVLDVEEPPAEIHIDDGEELKME